MMEEKFRERLYQVSEEFSAELTTNKEELQARHKKQLGEWIVMGGGVCWFVSIAHCKMLNF